MPSWRSFTDQVLHFLLTTKTQRHEAPLPWRDEADPVRALPGAAFLGITSDKLLEKLLVILVTSPLGLWCVYLPFRSLRRGSITYNWCTFERRTSPFWFWSYTVAAALVGILLLACGTYLLIYR